MPTQADVYTTAYLLLAENGEEAHEDLVDRADQLDRAGEQEACHQVLRVLSAVEVLMDMEFRGPVH